MATAMHSSQAIAQSLLRCAFTTDRSTFLATLKPPQNSLLGTLEQAAKELMQEERKTIICWSGGLDSSLTLALLKNAGLNPKVLCNPEALQRCPAFTSDWLDQLEVIHSWNSSSGELLISGTHADPLMLPHIVEYLGLQRCPQELARPWQELFINIFPKPLAQRCIQSFKEQLYIAGPNFPIEDIGQFLWWLDNCSCWDSDEAVYLRSFNLAEKQHRSLFAHPQVQSWAAYTHWSNKVDFSQRPKKIAILTAMKTLWPECPPEQFIYNDVDSPELDIDYPPINSRTDVFYRLPLQTNQ